MESSQINGAASQDAPFKATNAVLKPSDPVPEGAQQVRGIEFNDYTDRKMTVEDLVAGMANMGFQASAVGDAVRIINNMVFHPPYGLHQNSLLIDPTYSVPGEIQKQATKQQYSWATHPTSSPPASAKRSAI